MAADLQRIIKIVFQGSNETGQAFKDVGKGIETIGSSVATLTGPFADVAKDILKVQTAVGAALVAIGGFAIKAAGEFEDGMNEINSLMGLTETDFANFKDEIRSYFRDSVFDMDDVLKATYQSISLGIPQESVTKFLKSAEDLAIAGDVELTTAVNLLANTANAYGGTIDDVSGYADAFFTAVQTGGETIETLEANMGKVVAFAAPFGVSIDDAVAALTSLVAMGVGDSAQSATALAALIQALVNPTESAAAAAAELGIELGADIFENATLADVMEDIGDKTGGSAGEMQKFITSSNALKAALPLVADEANTYANSVEAMGTKHDAAADAAKIMAENLSVAHTKVSKSVKDVLIGIGLPLLDEYKEAMGGIGDLFEGVSIGLEDGAFDDLLAHFSGVLQDVGQFAADVAKVLPEALAKVDWAALIKSFESIEGAFGDIMEAIFGDVDLTTVDGLATGIQNAVNALVGLNELSAGILSQLPPFFSALKSIAEFLVGLDPATFKAIGTALGAALLINIGASTIASIGTAIGSAGKAIQALSALKAGAALTAMATGMGTVATAAGPFLAALGVGAAVGTGINWAIDKTVKTFTDADSLGGLVYDWVHGDGSETLERGGEDFERILAAITSNIDDFDVSALSGRLEQIGFDLAGLSDAAILEMAVELDQVSYDDLMDLLRTRAGDEELEVNLDVAVEESAEEAMAILRTKVQDEEIETNIQAGVQESDDLPPFLARWNELATDPTRPLGVEVDVEGQENIDALDEQIRNVTDTVTIEVESDEVQIARIQQQFETLRELGKMRLELEIAEVEANAAKVQSAFESLGAGLQSSADVMGSMLGAFAQLASEGGSRDFTNFLMQQMRAEMKIRQQMVDTQTDLANAEIKWMEARIKAMNRGDALIKIDGTHLAPHLEAFMWETLAAIQVRMNEEGQAMLFGM